MSSEQRWKLLLVSFLMKSEIFEDVVNFLVDKLPPDEVISFHPSARAQERFNELSSAMKAGTATLEERTEMDQSIQLEHMMQLAKARARIKQTQSVTSAPG